MGNDSNAPPTPTPPPAPPVAELGAGGTPAIQPTAPAVTPRTPTISAAPSPGPLDRVWSAISEGIPAFNSKFEAAAHTETGKLATGETPKMQLVTPEAAMTETERKAHPIATGIAETAGGMTSPESAAMIVGTGGFGELPGTAGRLIPKLVSLGFSAQALKGAYDQLPEFKKALDSGDASEAERILTHVTLDTAMGVAAGAHGTEGVGAHLAETGKTFAESVAEEAKKMATATAPEASPEAGKVPIGKLDNVPGAKRLPDVERRDLSTRIFPSGEQTRIGQTANRTFEAIRQSEADAKGGTVERPTIKTDGPDWDRTHSAEVGGKKVGSVGYKTSPDGTAQLYGSVVDPEMRGQGIGQKLYQSAIDEARASGASRITSDSTGVSPDAARVWERMRAKGVPVEDITHPNGKPGFQIDLTKPSPDPKFGQVLADRGQHPGQTVVFDKSIGAKYVGRESDIYSAERLQQMHAEAQRRIQHGTGQPDDRATRGGGDSDREADVARGKSEVAAADKGIPSEKIVTAEKSKNKLPDDVKFVSASPGFPVNPRTGGIPKTGHWTEAVPELRQVSDKPNTSEEIQKFAAQPAVKKMLAKYPELHVGGYKNSAGKYELNLSASSADPAAAKSVAGRLDQESTFDASTGDTNAAGGKNKKTSFPDYPIDQRLRDLAPKEPGETISTRYPTAVAATEDPLRHGLSLSGETLQRNPKLVEKWANAVKNVAGFKAPEGASASETVEAYINHVKDNLKWLYNQSSPEDQAANQKWYEGAHQITKDLSEEHGYSHPQTAGAMAAMSPQKDWDMTVSLTKRLTDIVKNQSSKKTTPEMLAQGKQIVAETQEVNPKANAALGKMLNKLKGKSLDELTDPMQRAAWVRLYDEAHNPRTFEKIGPDGKAGELRTNVDGTPSNVAWGSLNEINKAMSILHDGSRENISRTLGGAHKVRIFYNNIIDPNSARGDVTIDTHAVAAGLLRPLSGNDLEVKQNFQSPSSNIEGLKGTYSLYHEAYTRAAKELDIEHPRQLQSVVWEKVRDLFPSEFKTTENHEAINAIWKEHEDGKITADEARGRILDYAKSHSGPDAGVSEGEQPAGQQGELPLHSVYGKPAGGTGRGAGRRTPVGSKESEPEVAPRIFAREPAKKGTVSLDFLKGLSSLKKPAK